MGGVFRQTCSESIEAFSKDGSTQWLSASCEAGNYDFMTIKWKTLNRSLTELVWALIMPGSVAWRR